MTVKFKKSEFVDSVRELYLTEFPNPDRIGCPEPERLKSFAWRKDLEHSQEIALHLIRCSPCCQQEEQYLEEYRSHVKRKRFKTTLQVGAVVTPLLVLALLWAWPSGKPMERVEYAGAPGSVSENVASRPGEYQEAHLRLNDPSLGQDEANTGAGDDALQLAR